MKSRTRTTTLRIYHDGRLSSVVKGVDLRVRVGARVVLDPKQSTVEYRDHDDPRSD